MTRGARFLSAEQVIAMHDAVLRRWGGLEGGGHRGAAYEGVDAAVQAVKNSYYDTVEELAAGYAVYIVQGHVFLDGNKRTAAATMLTFLEANGARVRVGSDQVAGMMIELQRRSESGEGVAQLIAWIAGTLRGADTRAPRGRRLRGRRHEG